MVRLGLDLLWLRLVLGFGLGCSKEWKMNESQSPHKVRGKKKNKCVCVVVAAVYFRILCPD